MINIKDILSDNIIINSNYKNKTLTTLATDKVDDGTIQYQMNEHGYRSRSLEMLTEYNVLTLGCSWTMGIGVDNEKTWPSLMEQKINDNSNRYCHVFNYSMYGVSTSYISKILFKIVNFQFKPNLVLIMWPGFSRRDYIKEDGLFKKVGGFRYAHKDDVVWRNDNEDKLFIELRNDYQDSMIFWESYKFVETICKLHNIRVFHTIAGYYYDTFKTLELYNTIDNEIFFDPINCYKNDFNARDKEHPSEEWHKEFSENFFTFIKNKI